MRPSVFIGVVVASIGGPLALATIYLPGIAGDALPASGLTIVLAVIVFLAPLAIWLGYSKQIASAGGLTAFVEAAAGKTVARIQAGIWIVSYFLYLPYTIYDIVYEFLAPVFPGIVPYRGSLELILPVAICLFAFISLNTAGLILTVVAVGQLVLVAVLGGILWAHGGASSTAFTAHVGTEPLGHGVGAIALLFICASLPLFFGAEVAGGTAAIRRGLAWGYGIVAVFVLFAFIPYATGSGGHAVGAMPGVSIAQAYAGRPLAVAIAIGAAASIAALVVLELLTLGRLIHYLVRTPIRPTLAVIAVAFVAADALSLINPERFDELVSHPSLIALYATQLIVFIVYPLYRRREKARRLLTALGIAAIASTLAGYGLYLAIRSGVVGT